MPIRAESLKALNEETQNIPIVQERWAELAVELSQLRAAAEAALTVHDFDCDPSEFPALLRCSRK